MGMLSWSLLTVVDGIFVGWGIGSHAIAAINISYPIFIILTGFALMVGTGASVVASIHLSKDNLKAARINVTQALAFSSAVTSVAILLVEIFPERVSYMLGASDSLMPLVRDYMVWLVPSCIAQVWSVIGLFIIRLSGAPRYAMWCNVIPAILNMFLDWLLVFPLGMGVKGAAIASSLSIAAGGIMAIAYFFYSGCTLRLYRLKLSLTSLKLTLRNIGYQCKIGLSSMLGEFNMAILMLAGNTVFMHYLGDAGVGAYGIACYYFPFVFTFSNSIWESAQPIVSYNYGLGRTDRILATVSISSITAVFSALFAIIAFTLFPQYLVHLFIPASDPAAHIAISGLPCYALGFLFYIFNTLFIGLFQSVELVKPSVAFSLLRGVVFVVPSFMFLPKLIGNSGMWLAMPLAEFAVFIAIAIYLLCSYKRILKL